MTLIRKNHQRTYMVTFKLDETTDPKQFDYGWPNGRLKGIYKFEGGNCIISHRWKSAPNDPERPTDFVSEKGNDVCVVVLTRGEKGIMSGPSRNPSP